jgi:hypothetical protein
MAEICSYKIKNQCGRICGNINCGRHKRLLATNTIQKVATQLLEDQPLHTTVGGHNFTELLFMKWKKYPCESYQEDQEMLIYLCDICTLREIVCEMRGHICLCARKVVLAEYILSSLYNIYRYQRVPAVMNVIQRAQRRIRAQRWQRLQGPFVEAGVHITNTEDPITLTPMDELPPKEVWSFRDENGHVYAFHAPEIHFAIYRLGAWNPINRLPIPEPDVERLEKMMDILPWKRCI